MVVGRIMPQPHLCGLWACSFFRCCCFCYRIEFKHTSHTSLRMFVGKTSQNDGHIQTIPNRLTAHFDRTFSTIPPLTSLAYEHIRSHTHADSDRDFFVHWETVHIITIYVYTQLRATACGLEFIVQRRKCAKECEFVRETLTPSILSAYTNSLYTRNQAEEWNRKSFDMSYYIYI